MGVGDGGVWEFAVRGCAGGIGVERRCGEGVESVCCDGMKRGRERERGRWLVTSNS